MYDWSFEGQRTAGKVKVAFPAIANKEIRVLSVYRE